MTGGAPSAAGVAGANSPPSPPPPPSEDGEAWLYLPKRAPASPLPPVIVMAHGIGGQKEMGLHGFASKFADAGLAAFVIDYRTFGGSGGEPRHWASPARHVDDVVAAARYVKDALKDKVDVGKIALWGSSLAGGHVLAAGARLGGDVAAIVSQVPHLSGPAASRNNLRTRGPLGVARLALAGLHDVARTLSGRGPAYVTLAGRVGDLAFMQLADDELAEYFSKHPKDGYAGGWQNRVRARFALEIARYSPGRKLADTTCPVLLVLAKRDTQCPPGVGRDLAASVGPRVRVVELDAAHFEVYRGAHFEAAVAAETAFLREVLAV